MAYAFRCNNCGRLVSSADAGERHLPASCPSCGSGVSFDPKTGLKTFDDDNWTVLSELSGDERKELAKDHGLAVGEMFEEHTPAEASGAEGGADLHLVASEGITTEDQA